jgi:hypothetical protein
MHNDEFIISPLTALVRRNQEVDISDKYNMSGIVISTLFNDALHQLRINRMNGWQANDEFERIWKKAAEASFTVLPQQ